MKYPELIAHIETIIALDDSEKATVVSFFKEHSVKKKTNLLEEGQVCNKQYFVLKGCLRNHIINKKGAEQTLQFAIENWWITDYTSFQNKQPSHFFIQAVENSVILEIDRSALEELCIKIPKMERYFRIILQKAFAAAQMRINYLFTMSAEERYNHFNKVVPEFVQRVPQYMLASYLDFTPEFMSKIRAGKI